MVINRIEASLQFVATLNKNDSGDSWNLIITLLLDSSLSHLFSLCEHQMPRTETLFMDKQLAGKAETLPLVFLNHSCLTFCLVKWV